ncbi:hypothetical protein HNY73_007450 [Argiope bruennichi]|uniref:MULE transposase domain-containing protein n=1 Tax=Argiope bruennichi TaxID=94029 RepID=A0A8T0FDZ8_ARGBR|nr:hypothetical protein HNY73_007450 [Argiope bruennichi]
MNFIRQEVKGEEMINLARAGFGSQPGCRRRDNDRIHNEQLQPIESTIASALVSLQTQVWFPNKSLAEKLAMKIPLDIILDDVRESISESGMQRLHLPTRQDLYNIENSYLLTSKKHFDDAISVDIWAQNEMLKKYGPDCICVDGTHGLSDYGFQLMIYGKDFHVFFISDREDEEALSIFFKYIKNELGPVTPAIFMSDMANAFYNAWSTIMGLPKQHLYCTWYVDRAWRKNLSKINGKEKQVEVYKLLRTLLEERDENAVIAIIETSLNDLSAEADTFAFAEYFKTHYLNKLRQWAFCYMLHCGLNTNMHLERMHKTIKYIYLNGKTVKRLDKALDALMRFLKDKIVERLATLDKGKISSKLKNLRNRHKISCKLEAIIDKCEEGWNVQE